MKKLLLFSALLIFACSSDDDSEDNPLPAYTIEGKWLIEGTVPAGNTMYLYEDGVRYTYYCVEGDCNALYNYSEYTQYLFNILFHQAKIACFFEKDHSEKKLDMLSEVLDIKDWRRISARA
ncbi:hypothetical protein [Polaribacter sp.]|uniref:hypothetical protein n=1 Tax=Polaribacter sp. TaxID=1920175 RepID=UPI0025D7F74C|nr:hypothetical protein [Polaribacter sp.]